MKRPSGNPAALTFNGWTTAGWTSDEGCENGIFRAGTGVDDGLCKTSAIEKLTICTLE